MGDRWSSEWRLVEAAVRVWGVSATERCQESVWRGGAGAGGGRVGGRCGW